MSRYIPGFTEDDDGSSHRIMQAGNVSYDIVVIPVENSEKWMMYIQADTLKDGIEVKPGAAHRPQYFDKDKAREASDLLRQLRYRLKYDVVFNPGDIPLFATGPEGITEQEVKEMVGYFAEKETQQPSSQLSSIAIPVTRAITDGEKMDIAAVLTKLHPGDEHEHHQKRAKALQDIVDILQGKQREQGEGPTL